MVRQYAPILVLAIVLLTFTGLGYWAGTARDDSNKATVTNRTSEGDLSSGRHFCVRYVVQEVSQERCFYVHTPPDQQYVPPDCWQDAKIGEALPDSCR